MNDAVLGDAYDRLGNTVPCTDALVHEYNLWLASSKLYGHSRPPVPVGMIPLMRRDGSLPLQSNYNFNEEN